MIDVREDYEFEEFNLDGQLIPLGNFPGVIPNLEEHKDKEIIIQDSEIYILLSISDPALVQKSFICRKRSFIYSFCYFTKYAVIKLICIGSLWVFIAQI